MKDLDTVVNYAYQWAMYDQDMASRFYRIFMSVKGCEDHIL